MELIAVGSRDALLARAVDAWRALRPGGAEPARVDLLKGRKERKIVCRLHDAGPAGASVIAKRCRLATGLAEQAAYDRVLPALPVTALRCHGLVEEPDGTHCWLFIEDAGDAHYSAANDAHRRLAGRWLGALHAAAPAAVAAALPERGPRHYLECLRRTQAAIEQSRDNPALGPAHHAVLDALVARLARLEGRWRAVEERCAAMPETVVHGDFVPKNLRVRRDAGGLTLLCFDWGGSGRGPAAVDLAQAPPSVRRFSADVDLEAYLRVVRPRWPHADLATVRGWASIGSVFRTLGALAWASRSLSSGWVDERVAEMRVAAAILARADGAIGGGDGA